MEEKLQRELNMCSENFMFFTLLTSAELCLQNLNLLETNSLVKMDDGFILQPTGMRIF